GQAVQYVGAQRPLSGEKLVQHERGDPGTLGNGGEGKRAAVDGTAQFAAERGFFAGLLAHLVAGGQVRQLGRDLFPVAAEPILLFGGQGARDTSALGGSHGDLSAGLRDFIGRDRRNRHGVDRFVHRDEVATVLGVTPNARKAGG